MAASRKKGKWTGGTVPLGYDAKEKKLVINKSEAQTVRTIFQLYLELRSFGKLVAELDRRRIVTKRRDSKIAKYRGGIPFTYGPLAYFLKNRIYLGETHHGGKWFKGEHVAILDRETFNRVQQLLKENNARRGTKFSVSGALLKGKLFDDKGNRMGPTFSSKNGVRYRFYVSTALRGRKQKAGSVSRISAPEIENLVEAEVRKKLNADEAAIEDVFGRIRHVKVSASKIQIILEGARNDKRPIEIPWAAPTPKGHGHIQLASSETNADPKLLKAIVRAQHWLKQLSNGQSSSIEDLATAAGYNPKVIRQGLRLAFLAPEVAAAALDGETQIRLKQIPKSLPLSWREQHRSMN